MEAGASVWLTDGDGDAAWVLCEVLKKTATLLECENVKTQKVYQREALPITEDNPALKYKGVELANTPLSDEDIAEGRDDDLITLPHLHEPALLHAISDRFFRGEIYTWTGPILIAVNPFERLPLYTSEILDKYRRDGLLRSQNLGNAKTELGPHVYAIADRSFRQMMAPPRKSQSILISGESGAGKTESTKIVMLYLTTLGSANLEQDDEQTSVMDRVLQSNPILEAFGNAKTLRNDNSSRFGKFIELGFNRAGYLQGAKVQTYLLEKVRLAYHASGERNYHIFYQLLRGATEEQKKQYHFHDGLTQGLELSAYFHYTGQGGAPHLREFTDESGLQYTLKGMRGMGWPEDKINTVLSLIAGLLHLGQIDFKSETNDSGIEAAVVQDDTILEHSATFLGVDIDKLRVALTERVIVARGQEITTQLTAEKAHDARDALAKTIYGGLFLWVVSQVNKSICWEHDSDVKSSCGVLDIFGFECFAVNSFEQLCINFTNEALQQQFNKFIFKLEQAEYEREEIDWAFVSFPDNQDCLDTIQMKKVGILAMLDDECRLPRGSDKNWAMRMYEHFLPNKPHQVESDNTRFSATPVQKSRSVFCVRHFAGVVQYSAETGFMEKNKDEIPLTAEKMCESADSWLMRDLFQINKESVSEPKKDTTTTKPGKGKPSKQATVGMQFKEQLASLIESVEKTDPHYIRCLKSNDAAKPKMMTRKRVTEQLRYGGVLEAVRVARMGYPVRLEHVGFFPRYRMLLPAVPDEVLPWSLEGQDVQQMCIKLLDVVLEEGQKQKDLIASQGPLKPDEEGITRAEKIRRMQLQPDPITFPKVDVQLGLSKVFMRKAPHDALEAHRVFHQRAAATLIQCWVRGLEQRKRYLIIRHATMTIQRVYRGMKGRQRWMTLRQDVAGHLLVKHFRMQILRRRFQRLRKGMVLYQALWRGYATRRTLAAIRIQTFVRYIKPRYVFRKLKTAVLALQCALRMKHALAIYNELKKEQKDVGKLKGQNEKLKQEMMALRAMLTAQAHEDQSRIENDKALGAKQDEIDKLEKRIAELEMEIKKEKARVIAMEASFQKSKDTYEREKVVLTSTLDQQRQQLSAAAKGDAAVASSKMIPPSPQAAGHNRSASYEANLAAAAAAAARDMPAYDASQATPGMVGISPEMLAEHKALVASLEEELEAERMHRREADGEIIKLRAAMNGVTLQDSDVEALLPEKLEEASIASSVNTNTNTNNNKKFELDVPTDAEHFVGKVSIPGVATATQPPPATTITTTTTSSTTTPAPPKRPALGKLGIEEKSGDAPAPGTSPQRFSLKSPKEYLPMIRRGFSARKEETAEEVVAVGWKHEATNRKEREEALRDEVHQFEAKIRKFNSVLEDGLDVVMWQLNRNAADLGASEERDEFALKATPLTVKMHRRGDLFIQAVLTFSMRGGYLSKALGRNRLDKSALDPLSLHDILAVQAGCSGYDHAQLPIAATTKTKGKTKGGNKENRQSSLFLTIKATPTPVASSRAYFLRFKSRAARNDVLSGLRSILADMQIHEGVSVSTLHKKTGDGSGGDDSKKGAHALTKEEQEILVPLVEVHNAINREREAYDRLLLLLLQGKEDLTDKEDEMLSMRGKLDTVLQESAEKDRVQANDSKLIMQLSKKLETLLMDNEDLRDQNDRLNSRLVAVECEKMNM
eukprot:CAMPEP_0195287286 /NCGR_PEP_ID=MMETSP0707-20130614/4408_1 /TAXON_ID=33640 /ORGANISM="Asterionellopsis glacialis, Strain CCMP134" /LENGTH=1669 /DNA_ID=CAMNT_0040347029 /DNA_START=146 /DNA_END=5155 /DNA_ORIENTATION=+